MCKVLIINKSVVLLRQKYPETILLRQNTILRALIYRHL
nr:MAG TPA: hypothetical protein [Caudoviricetes sp.]